jgi:hypothetical protein
MEPPVVRSGAATSHGEEIIVSGTPAQRAARAFLREHVHAPGGGSRVAPARAWRSVAR